MSYILNALKKAEQDRLREEPQDLDDFVNGGWDPYQKTSQSSLVSTGGYWLPIAIIVIAACLFYGFSNLSSEVGVIVPDAVAEIEIAPQVSPTSVAVVEKNIPAEKPLVATPEIVPVATENHSLPDINITGHIFIRSGSRLNQIFAGESTYHVGDKLDSNWVIESINSDSLELRSGTKTTELPLR